MGRASLDQVSEAPLKQPTTAFFNDGYRQIDCILAYQPDVIGKKQAQKVRFRQKFEMAMKKEGLELEVEGKENSQDGKTTFIKVHATWQALTRQAELERIQMPIMESDLEPKKTSFMNRTVTAISNRLHRLSPFELQPAYRIERKRYFTDAYDRNRQEQFMIRDQDHFFTQAQRLSLTWSIISGITVSLNVQKQRKSARRAREHEDIMDNESSFGGSTFELESNGMSEDDRPAKIRVKNANIQYLLGNETYSDVFPVHDCELDETGNDPTDWSTIPIELWPKRKYLRTAWGNFSQWHRHQPLDEIRDYFGEKVAIYYAWLGFYTKMLIFPSIFGIFIVLWGIWHSFHSPEANSFCNSDINGTANGTTDLLFCRACPEPICPFIDPKDECINARLSAVIDNWGTTIFSVFMAVWVVIFLEKWKRYQSELRVRWDVSENELSGVQQIRPEYALKVNTTRLNPVTQRLEPFLPKRSLLQRTAISVSSVIFFLFVVLALISTVMAYKIVGPVFWYAQLRYKDPKTGSIEVSVSPTLLTSITASILNGVFIAIMTKIYMKIAWKLTELEMPRTQDNFEESFTYKVFIFQFVNFYGSLFYLSFVRVFKTGNPIFSDSSRCPPTGCLLDVSIQLFIIMTGKQAVNNLLEVGIPAIKNWWKRRKSLQSASDYARWEQDYDLTAPQGISLFGDYLEMLIQFGFITMFVPAFPLAPLFALINNIIEIRLDAYNVLVQNRREIPVRVKDIGTWYGLLKVISRLAVVTNGFLIALTTSFLDRLYYEFNKNLPGEREQSYFDFILTPFETLDWCSNQTASNITSLISLSSLESNCTVLRTYDHEGSSALIEHCYFRAYANPSENYMPTLSYYVVYLVKFLYVIFFEHAVLLIQAFLCYMIPDVPDHVVVRQQREAFLQRQAFKEHELGPTEKTDEIQVNEDEFTAEDPLKPWNLESFVSNLPKDVAVNKLGTQPTTEMQPKRSPRSIYGMLFRKAIVCSE